MKAEQNNAEEIINSPEKETYTPKSDRTTMMACLKKNWLIFMIANDLIQSGCCVNYTIRLFC